MVKIKIDRNNREALMRLHTATHILNFSCRQILGNHIWQNGSNLKKEYGTLDITHFDNLTQDEICKIENLVNKTIFENKELMVEELDRDVAEKKYGFILYQGGAIPMKVLRVVSIDNNDVEACGGLHVKNTSQIGFFKIVDTQKIQDGVIRIKFVVEDYALKFVSERELKLKSICNVFLASEETVEKSSRKIFDEWKQRGKEIDRLKLDFKKALLFQIEFSNLNSFELKNDFDMAFILELFNDVKKIRDSFKLISSKFIVATSDVEVLDDFKKVIDKKSFKIYIK
jgi:alanyl-tRNA synthetase